MQSNRIAHAARALALAVSLTVAAGDANAQGAYPTRPVRIIVNTAPGGLADLTARIVAEKMSEKLGQSFVVENKAGGDGLIGIQAARSAPADGYTLMVSASTMATLPAIKQNPGYDPVKDFIGIGFTIRSPVLLVVGRDKTDRTLKDFLERARANPQSVTYASAGMGTATHIGAALMWRKLGLDIMHIPYKGNGAALPDVMAGRVDMILEGIGSAAAKLKDGSLRALAITSTKRIASLPEVPTFRDEGIDFSYYLWIGLFAPAETPPAIVEKLEGALRYATGHKDVVSRFEADGADTPQMTSAEFSAFVAGAVGTMAKLAADLKIPKQ